MRTEIVALEGATASSRHQHSIVSDRLRRREDDLVLILSRFEALQHEHAALQMSAVVSERCAAHTACRLGCDAGLKHVDTGCTSESTTLRQQSDAARSALCMRERQLALLVAQLESARSDAGAARTHVSANEQHLKALLAERESQLAIFVHELFELATAERRPGSVAYDARSRMFRRCAAICEALGHSLPIECGTG